MNICTHTTTLKTSNCPAASEGFLPRFLQRLFQEEQASPYAYAVRYLLAKHCLQALAPQVNAQTVLAPFFPHSLPALPAHLENPLRAWLAQTPVGGEGTAGVLSAEAVGLLSERESSSPARTGIFYTPFHQGRQLARETLCAWLGWPSLDQSFWQTLPAEKRQHIDQRLAQLTVCDPAAGAGGLLIPFWLELASLRQALNPTQSLGELLRACVQHNLYAADIRPQATADLRLRLALTLASYGQSIPHFEHIYTFDSLAGRERSVWQETCSEVFAQGGFDIFLANPPYIGQKNNKSLFTSLRQNPHWKEWLTPKSDVLYLFFHLAFDLLRPGGTAGLLTTTYFAQASAAYTLRKRLCQHATLHRLIDFGEEKIFSRAKGQHNLITVFSPGGPTAQPCTLGQTPTPCLPENLFSGPHLFLTTQSIPHAVEQLLRQMAASPYTLKQVATISNGLMTGCDKAFILTEAQKNALVLNEAEKQKLKPFFKNSDIKPYVPRLQPRLWLIDFFFPQDKETDVSLYPHLLVHLAQFKTQLLARKQNNNGIDKQLAAGKYWFASVRRRMNFEAEKLMIPHRCATNTFAYSNGPWYASSDVYFISSVVPPWNVWYLLALLNSTPYYFWLYYKGKRKGKLLELYSSPLGELPIPCPAPAIQEELAQLARQIFTCKATHPQADTSVLQNRINQRVYELFNLTPQQAKLVNQLAPEK